MLLQRPIITSMSFEDIMSLPETKGILNALDKRYHVEFTTIALTHYKDITDESYLLKRQDDSVTRDDKLEKLSKTKIVPKRFKGMCHTEFTRDRMTDRKKTTLSSFFVGIRNRSNSDLWNILYNMPLIGNETVIVETSVILSTAILEIVSNEDITARCTIDTSIDGKPIFEYSRNWNYHVKSKLGCRGSSTTSITGIVTKIVTYVNLVKTEKEQDAKDKKIREFVIDNVEKVLGTREVDFAHINSISEAYDTIFTIGKNGNVKYIHRPDGTVALYYISSEILCKLDPVLAMTLFR